MNKLVPLLSPRRRAWLALGGAILAAVACGTAGGTDVQNTPSGSAGKAGGATGGTGGGAGASTGGTGATTSGGSGGSAGGIVTTGGSGGTGGTEDDGGGLQDAKPDVGDAACTMGQPPGPGPLPHTCAPKTASECDGKSDTNAALPNGSTGNGFDDDCDGLVDEGCACDDAHPPGTTRDCYLVPASQADPGTKLPVGWCKENAKGNIACVKQGSGEFEGKVWDGYCKGAQPPFADDACGPGDFDCDGKDANPKTEDCACKEVTVTCPTDAVVISPYPDPKNLEKKKKNPFDPKPNDPFIVDGHTWISDNQGPKATGWKWTITGGDCDNILPHATFAVYTGKDTTVAKRVGQELSNLGSNKKQKGLVVGPANDAHQIWPAFSLSGDYVVQGEFDLAGQHYSCTTKVQVRAPGLRAEMCWDMGNSAPLGLTDSDVDLHLARLQGTTCSGKHGWFDACGKAPSSDDCNYQCESGCRTGNNGFCFGLAAPAPGWGYPASDGDACHGWGSLREPQQSCDNPRLDRDNLGCNTKITNPNDFGGFQNPLQNFCGPENINLDNPKAGDQFLVGVHFYSGTDAHPHVNIYCNGERKLALGYDPTTDPPVLFPRLTKSFGQDMNAMYENGDMWEVARVQWKGDAADPCAIEPVPSKTPKPDKDGSTNACVDTNQQNKANATSTDRWLFMPGGAAPAAPTPVSAACWH